MFGSEGLAADSPLAAFDFFDNDPRVWPKVFALDGHHRLGELLDHFPLLRGGEDAFDELDGEQRHGVLQSIFQTSVARERHERFAPGGEQYAARLGEKVYSWYTPDQ